MPLCSCAEYALVVGQLLLRNCFMPLYTAALADPLLKSLSQSRYTRPLRRCAHQAGTLPSGARGCVLSPVTLCGRGSGVATLISDAILHQSAAPRARVVCLCVAEQSEFLDPCGLPYTGVAPGTTPSDVRNFLSKIGQVKEMYLPVHHLERTPRSYCFFDYERESDGERAMKELNNQMLMGFRVTVQMANSDPKTPEQMRTIYERKDEEYPAWTSRCDSAAKRCMRELSRAGSVLVARYYAVAAFRTECVSVVLFIAANANACMTEAPSLEEGRVQRLPCCGGDLEAETEAGALMTGITGAAGDATATAVAGAEPAAVAGASREEGGPAAAAGVAGASTAAGTGAGGAVAAAEASAAAAAAALSAATTTAQGGAGIPV
ncbi:hypothetical protein, conserved [Eimeria acervulina]|uniref:RRM domain-containing protein n=1 Tax=Eimeria acervulina TaxID=5801 RepID=U6GBV2_EIMAC|nr:hypothetical protein, conserved [Eimeria acervulina]CDI76049.1 hypothetical protein, conserved [Eimeria acervulina]